MLQKQYWALQKDANRNSDASCKMPKLNRSKLLRGREGIMRDHCLVQIQTELHAEYCSRPKYKVPI